MILLIFAGVILIAIFQDSQVLRRLEDPAYARGVITFLISLAAIGLAFMFVYQALTASNTSEAGFQRGHEVLSGLMGVLGTIVGFYFGSTDKIGGAQGDLQSKDGWLLITLPAGAKPTKATLDLEDAKDLTATKSLDLTSNKDNSTPTSPDAAATISPPAKPAANPGNGGTPPEPAPHK